MAKKKDFRFKQFGLNQDQCAMKIGTDGILLGTWVSLLPENQHVLDVGTGTGLIALMLAQRNQNANVVGVELDKRAFDQACQNVAESPFKQQVKMVHSSIQDFAKKDHCTKFDLVVSNPPFFTDGVLSDKHSRTNARHTTQLTHADLLQSVQLLLKKDGRFCVVLPVNEGLAFIELSKKYDFSLLKICQVKPRPNKPANRLLLTFSSEVSGACQESELCIYAEPKDSVYSADYQLLTRAFYL